MKEGQIADFQLPIADLRSAELLLDLSLRLAIGNRQSAIGNDLN